MSWARPAGGPKKRALNSFFILTHVGFFLERRGEPPPRPPEDQPGRASPRPSNQQRPRESPPPRNAGPHPGTTRNHKTGGTTHQPTEQPGHAGQAAPGPRTTRRPRRKTQLLSCTLHTASPPRPHPTSPKAPKSPKPRPKRQPPQGAARRATTPKVKNHQTQPHPHPAPARHRTPWQKNKDNKLNTKKAIIEHKRSNKINNRT
ncbi:hypothetical protein TNCV_1341591 [Trichonephila clavipes]|uniref:Uncharacterized protein n=1 Tax=Trichonephila clavipes TaxID=2585209 RepID=A0A8X6RTP4_TRICX|nr:hypothetical protein TNCV_1341591 [Trichonephila clavipes]